MLLLGLKNCNIVNNFERVFYVRNLTNLQIVGLMWKISMSFFGYVLIFFQGFWYRTVSCMIDAEYFPPFQYFEER